MFHDDRTERDYSRDRRRFQRDDRRPIRGEREKPVLTRERIERQVYCHNLPFRSSWQDLKDYMRNAGDVEHVKMMEGQNGRSRGCAVVTFMDKEGARNAIGTLNGTQFQGRHILIREDRSSSFVRASGEEDPPRSRPGYRNRYEDDHYYSKRSPRDRERYRQRSRTPPPRFSRHRRDTPPSGRDREYRGSRYESKRSYNDERYVPEKDEEKRE